MAATLVGTTLLTGCAEKQEASTTLPTPGEYAPIEPTTTTSTLPPLGPPDFPVPPEARVQDPAGAEAFLRYYIELIDRQQTVAVGQPLRDLGPDCETCARIARQLDEIAAAGQRFQGGQVSLENETEPQMDGDTASISFTVRQEAAALIDQSGAVVPGSQTEVAPRLESGSTLNWSDAEHAWLVKSMTIG